MPDWDWVPGASLSSLAHSRASPPPTHTHAPHTHTPPPSPTSLPHAHIHLQPSPSTPTPHTRTLLHSQIAWVENTADDPSRRRPDITKVKTLLGWEPKVPLHEGLLKMVDDFKRCGAVRWGEVGWVRAGEERVAPSGSPLSHTSTPPAPPPPHPRRRLHIDEGTSNADA